MNTSDATTRHRRGQVTVTVLARDGQPLRDGTSPSSSGGTRSRSATSGSTSSRSSAGRTPTARPCGGAPLRPRRVRRAVAGPVQHRDAAVLLGRLRAARGASRTRARLPRPPAGSPSAASRVKGHPLVWHTVAPPGCSTSPLDEVERGPARADPRATSAASPALIDTWDAINEAVIMPVFENGEQRDHPAGPGPRPDPHGPAGVRGGPRAPTRRRPCCSTTSTCPPRTST